MTLTSLRGRLYLFGGSGTSAKCFQDLQILDRQQMAWLDVSQRDGKRMIPSYRDASVEGTSNPNEEDFVPSVLIHGRGPSQRAGHTATAVQRTIFIFGGSVGSEYLNDFFVLDTDPNPEAVVNELTSLQLLERRLRHFCNVEELSDVIFVVQGQRVYAHKMILSIVSECFRGKLPCTELIHVLT
jgi:Kelch motif/BTB/POZ domain